MPWQLQTRNLCPVSAEELKYEPFYHVYYRAVPVLEDTLRVACVGCNRVGPNNCCGVRAELAGISQQRRQRRRNWAALARAEYFHPLGLHALRKVAICSATVLQPSHTLSEQPSGWW